SEAARVPDDALPVRGGERVGLHKRLREMGEALEMPPSLLPISLLQGPPGGAGFGQERCALLLEQEIRVQPPLDAESEVLDIRRADGHRFARWVPVPVERTAGTRSVRLMSPFCQANVVRTVVKTAGESSSGANTAGESQSAVTRKRPPRCPRSTSAY